MSYPGLIPGKRSAVFRAFVAVLQTNPGLRRVVKTWKVWSGKPDDGAPPATGQLPWVRVSPVPVAAAPATVSSTESHLGIQVELLVESVDAGDLMDLWEAIERAVFPGDQSVFPKLRAAGCYSTPILEQPGFGTAQLGDSLVLTAEGTFRIPIRIATLS